MHVQRRQTAQERGRNSPESTWLSHAVTTTSVLYSHLNCSFEKQCCGRLLIILLIMLLHFVIQFFFSLKATWIIGNSDDHSQDDWSSTVDIFTLEKDYSKQKNRKMFLCPSRNKDCIPVDFIPNYVNQTVSNATMEQFCLQVFSPAQE